jgi:Transcriptional regulators
VADSKYNVIFQTLRQRIEEGEYQFLSLLPPENALALEFACTRTTVHKALSLLADQGHVLPMRGRGVQVIYRRRPLPSNSSSTFLLGGIESLKEAASRNGFSLQTRMLSLEEGRVEDELAERSGMSKGDRILLLRRLRLLNDIPLILDVNVFLKSVVPHLTKRIVESSIYSHLEKKLKVTVGSARRTVTVERATEEDTSLLHLGDMGCVVAVTSSTFDMDGLLFEYTVSRHSPIGFEFNTTARRLPASI